MAFTHLNESRKSEKWRERQKHEPRMQLVSRNSLVRQVCMFSVSTEPSNQRAMNPNRTIGERLGRLLEI